MHFWKSFSSSSSSLLPRRLVPYRIVYLEAMVGVCNCTDFNRIAQIVDELVKEAAEEKAHLANQWWVVVLAYTFVILPWGLLYNIDFISEKWRTVHRTRFLGWVHMTFAIAPMPFIIYYAHLQQSSEDYKEMMAAVIAILMSLYHVLRTAWGLIQLASFSQWCSVLVQRMWRMGMIDEYRLNRILGGYEGAGGFQGSMEKIRRVFKNGSNCTKNHVRTALRFMKGTTDDIESDISEIQDEETENFVRLREMGSKILRVNNTVIDNELGGTDLTVKVRAWNVCVQKLKSMLVAKKNATGKDGLVGPSEFSKTDNITSSGFLAVEENELCAVRWSGSFLSTFGEHWSGSVNHEIDQDEMFEKCRFSLWFLDEVTFPVNGKKMRFSTMPWTGGGPYNSSLELSYLNSTPDWLKLRKGELENVMGAFPGSGSRPNIVRPDVVLVCALLYAQSIDEAVFDSIIDYHSKFTVSSTENGWNLLLWQNRELPSGSDSRASRWVPPFPWKKLFVPLWDKRSNWRVLQASVHADNRVHFNTADILEEGPVQPSCWFEYTRKKYRHADRTNNDHHYVGVVLESVRTFLAYWISSRNPNCKKDTDWCPKIPNGKYRFSTYQDGIDHLLWRWECQSKLHETIGDMDMNATDLPSCIELILLFILGLPGRMEETLESSVASTSFLEGDIPENVTEIVEVVEGTLLYSFDFIPDLTAQDIKVRIRIFEENGKEHKNVAIDLIAGASAKAFKWEDWINTAMGYLKAEEDAVIRKEGDDGTVPWRNRTPSKVILSRPLVRVSRKHGGLSNLHGNIEVWRGWPFFDLQIVQFEMNGWMRASGCLNGYCQMVKSYDYDFKEEARNAEDGLLEISDWPEPKWSLIMEENKKEIEIESVSENV